jgi:hypothetical protein
LCIILLDFFRGLWYNMYVNEREVFIMETIIVGSILCSGFVFGIIAFIIGRCTAPTKYKMLYLPSRSEDTEKRAPLPEMQSKTFFTAIANGAIDETVIAEAMRRIEAMDRQQEARQMGNDFLYEKISRIGGATREPMTVVEIASPLGCSPQKTAALCHALVARGILEKTDIKVPNRGVCRGYYLAN